MAALVLTLVALALAPPPAWIQRVVPPPIVGWREADVLGTPIVEGIAVDRDATFGVLTVNVGDSRFVGCAPARAMDCSGSRSPST
jgi:hypothetical protein